MRLHTHAAIPLSAPWNLHQTIVEQAQDAVIFANTDGVIELWNRGAEIIFGYSSAQAMGQPLDIIIPEKLKRAHHNGFCKAISTGVTRFDGRVMTTRGLHKYGCRLYVEMRFGLVKGPTEKIIGVFAIARDATARHMQEVAFAALAETSSRKN